MYSFANRCLLICLIVIVGLAISCGPGIIGPGCQTADPLMAGTWASPNVTLKVSHTLHGSCGLVAAHGVNTIAESPWDLLVFTGNIIQAGTATGDVYLFSSKNTSQTGAIANTDTTLQRQGNTLNFELKYTVAGKNYQTPYSLTKQP